MKDVERYAVIHGHFYQPPRENPWIEDIERQEGAAPFHDWNEEITYQCYLPNTVSRVLRNGKIADLVNNYSYISFNFGPTLLMWLEQHFPQVYDGIIEADSISMRRNNGHGNAMAQVFNHLILPLENLRDKHTQVAWGFRDFESRFGRKPEAMWLPETACNLETLDVLIDHGLKFVVLAPTQAEKIRPFGKDKWTDVSSNSIDPRKPYRHYMYGEDGSKNDKRFIDIFFYDGGLARSFAFSNITASAQTCADAIMKAFGSPDFSPVLMNVALDGETFGHHHQYSDMCLAFLAKYELLRRNVKIVNYGYYLELCPPKDEVQIKPGTNGEGTSWSCAHGVSRWRDDCGCTTGRMDFHQKWRRPFRQALRSLRDVLTPVYESEGDRIFHDPWKARDEYVDIIIDRSDDNVDRWLRGHVKVELDSRTRTKAIQLLEMQRYAMYMFTSCGWFFDELSRIETVQCMVYAARAAQLCREATGLDYEPKFKSDLELAPSNVPQFGNGRAVYEKFVQPAKASWDKIVAQYAIRLVMLPENAAPDRIYRFTVKGNGAEWERFSNWIFGIGRAHFFSGTTYEQRDAAYFFVYLTGTTMVQCFVKDCPGVQECEEMRQKIMAQAPELLNVGIRNIAGQFFNDPPFMLNDLFREDREKVISALMRERIETSKSDFKRIFYENVNLMDDYKSMGWLIPDELKIPSQYAIAVELAERLHASASDWNFDRVREIGKFLELSRKLGFQLNFSEAESVLHRMVMVKISMLIDDLNLHDAQQLHEALDLAADMQVSYKPYEPQNLMFHLLNEHVRKIIDRRENVAEKGEVVELVLKAAEKMGFDVEKFRQAALGFEKSVG